MKTLYIDCTAGIAGDMTVAALLDLGLPLEHLRRELATLPLPTASYHLSAGECLRQGVRGIHFQVQVEGDQHHRFYADIVTMIASSSLSDGIKEKAQLIFRRLAIAEARVHDLAIEKVHFHEVGAIDSIIDIVATAIGLEYLGIKEIHASALPWGSGFVETAHGLLAVPAPATAELLKGLAVHGDIGTGERVTPTGAAIVAALAARCGSAPEMTVKAVGYGAGGKDFPDRPNLLRLVLGEQHSQGGHKEVVVLETNIDDMSPEIGGFLMERLLAAGALDVAFSSLQMKKNRPGILLTVIATHEKRDELARLIVTESTAIGVRWHTAQRLELPRVLETCDTSLGPVRVKRLLDGERVTRVTPEFDDCRQLALDSGLPLLEVYRLVEREISRQ